MSATKRWIVYLLTVSVQLISLARGNTTNASSNRPTMPTPCSLCPPGHGVIIPCTRKKNTVCTPCVPGSSFSSNFSRDPCQPCSSCHDDEYEVRRCSRISDIVCRKCLGCKSVKKVVKVPIAEQGPANFKMRQVPADDSSSIEVPDMSQVAKERPLKMLDSEFTRTPVVMCCFGEGIHTTATLRDMTKTEDHKAVFDARQWQKNSDGKDERIEITKRKETSDRDSMFVTRGAPAPTTWYPLGTPTAAIAAKKNTYDGSDKVWKKLEREKDLAFHDSAHISDEPTAPTESAKDENHYDFDWSQDKTTRQIKTVVDDDSKTRDFSEHTADQQTEHQGPEAKKVRRIDEIKVTGGRKVNRRHSDEDVPTPHNNFQYDMPRVPSYFTSKGTTPYVQGRSKISTASKAYNNTGNGANNNPVYTLSGHVNYIIIGCAVAVTALVSFGAFTLIMRRKKARQLSEDNGIGGYAPCATSPRHSDTVSAGKFLEKRVVTSPVSSSYSFAYTAAAEGMFDSKGGRLSAKDSDIVIKVDHGTIPDGVGQALFYRVIYDARQLLQELPEGPERTIISPVFECGPSNANLKKPVEIVVPHCLCLDESNKARIAVFRCGSFSDKGPIWEKVSPASEKTSHSKAWFTVKKDTINIKTKTFSFWSIFACGAGPKKKRAAVFASKPIPGNDKIYLRFYVYSDNEDSKKRVEMQEKNRFQDSVTCTKEKPFKFYHDNRDLTVSLTKLEEGWTLDKTPDTQIYRFESGYHNGFRVKDSCDFVVTTTELDVKPFSCIVKFQQDDHAEHSFYVDPGMIAPGQNKERDANQPREEQPEACDVSRPASSEDNEHAHTASYRESSRQSAHEGDATSDATLCFVNFENELEPVSDETCNCICEDIGVEWRRLLRSLGVKQSVVEIIEEENRRVQERCYQGLLKWKEIKASQATVGVLVRALREIGKNDLAANLFSEVCHDQANGDAEEDNHDSKVPPV